MKKSNILIAAFAVIISASTFSMAESSGINFDGKTGDELSFADFSKAVGSCKNDNIECSQSVPAANSFRNLEIYASHEMRGGEAGVKEEGMRDNQQLMRRIVESYNSQRLHDESIRGLMLDGAKITLKLPGQTRITKDGVILNTIDDEILANTIRYNLSLNEATRGKCLTWVFETVAVWVIDHFLDKVVKVCAEYEPSDDNYHGGGANIHPLPINPPVRQ